MHPEPTLRLDVRDLSGPTGSPWTSDQLSRLIVSNLAALAGILAAAYGAAQSTETQTTLLWLNLSIAGIAVAGVANGLWVQRCRTAVATARTLVLEAARTTIRSADPAAADEPGHGFAWAPKLRRYHLPTCALVEGRPVRYASAGLLEARGLHACEVCLP